MPVSDAELLHAIETGMHVIPAVPGQLDYLTVPGVHARITPAPSPLANLAGLATLTPENADAAIRSLCDTYGARGLPFGWLIGPSTTPADLPRRLEAVGFVKGVEMAGMALRDLSVPIAQEEGISVREAQEGDDSHIVHLFTAGFGLPEMVSTIFMTALRSPDGKHRTGFYLAFLDGVEAPIAVAALVYLAGTPIVMLGGAATLPEYRGKGAYRALLARRLADACADGMEAAVIQAVRTTSAPICARIGMVEMCGLDMYVWSPGGDAGAAE